jgi:hypothetical protein
MATSSRPGVTMASWILVPCLQELRDEYNLLAPSRDKTSDGSIGDQAHASSPSDHNPDETGVTPYEDADSTNEVHAIDVDKDLNRSGWSMTRAVQVIVERHRDGRDDRLQNIIWDGKIWSRSWGWAARVYTGSNPHDKHAHYSARYTTTQENDRSPWGLLEEAGMGVLQADDKAYLASLVAPTVAGVRHAVKADPETREAVQGLVFLGIETAADGGVLVDAQMRVMWLAAWARRHDLNLADGGQGYSAYLNLSAADKVRARNAWDLMQELGLTLLLDPEVTQS